MKLHYHKAHHDENGKLTRICDECGEDLLHESHIMIRPKHEKPMVNFDGEQMPKMTEDFIDNLSHER